MLTLRSLMASGPLSSLGMRPARRSEMLPAASSVQKLQRMATSFGPTLKPTPVASNTPRPIRCFTGS